MVLGNKHCYLVAEIGLNHQGDVETAKSLIMLAKQYGWDCVKFQIRDIDSIYTAEEQAAPYTSPWGTTFGEYKWGREFDLGQYQQIDAFCESIGMSWTASVWDVGSVGFLVKNFRPPFIKVPSALITNMDLLKAVARTGVPVFLSTGMSDVKIIGRAMDTLYENRAVIGCLYHCVSTYPSKDEDINLTCLETLRRIYPDVDIGYSGHEKGISVSLVAVALGAKSIERHVTLDRTMFGSDHAASLEPEGFRRLARDIRRWERVKGDGVLRICDNEQLIIEKLRR